MLTLLQIKVLQKLMADRSGASAAEYALILAVIGVAVAALFGALGTAIGGAVSEATTAISA